MTKDQEEDIRILKHYLREIDRNLSENYPQWNEKGKDHAVTSAIKACEQAHKRIIHAFPELIDR